MSFTEWETPQTFFEMLDREFRFTLDVCANKSNTKCLAYYTPLDNSLKMVWDGVCWMNPPYDRSISDWMKKAYRSSQLGTTVVCLIQGRSTDTAWWHEYVMKSSEIRFIRDRLHFGKNGKFSRANISNILVVFRAYCQGPPSIGISYDARNYVCRTLANT